MDQKITDVTAEWNKNAEERHKQIISKIDISYHKVLIPTLLKLIGDVRGKKIIDVGCGSGVFANDLSEKGAFVVGVDPSKEMIRIANQEYGNKNKLKFYCQTIRSFSSSTTLKFDIAISNMSLVTIADLDIAFNSINRLLKTKGKLAFNITHPCFWNEYRIYEPAKTFNYNNEHAQKGKFVITRDSHGLPSPTTHFHRPLGRYIQSLLNASFLIENIVEPFPNSTNMKLYPTPWKYPRFLSMICAKN